MFTLLTVKDKAVTLCFPTEESVTLVLTFREILSLHSYSHNGH